MPLRYEKKLYIALCKDRHIDEVVRVFDTAEAAVEFCKAFVKSCRGERDLEEKVISGWFYYATYSCEGDSVRVEEVTLNNE